MREYDTHLELTFLLIQFSYLFTPSNINISQIELFENVPGLSSPDPSTNSDFNRISPSRKLKCK